MNIIREVFHLYGFEPLSTPILELQDTLYGKYGEDAENLIFQAQHGRSTSDPLAMRYDLTVPLARVVGMHWNDIRLPFKRYQIAPVFRGERPQRGRYRQFYQCDADIVGVSTMEADAELISLKSTIFTRLGFPPFSIKINNRQLLTGMGQYSGVPDDQLPDLYRSVDKFDKVGADGVRNELLKRGISQDVVTKMMELVTAHYPGTENLDFIADVMRDSEAAQAGVKQLRSMAAHMDNLGVPADHYEFDFTMVRGLGYYTGPIFETVITEPNLGSLSGGGRYDELIGLFRKESLPTTGTSLGIERIIDLMDELNLYPAHIAGTVVQVLVSVFNDETRADSAKFAAKLRQAGINSELYMDDGRLKLGKQFNHADKKGIPIVAIMGPDEIEKGLVSIKRLRDGEEVTVSVDEAAVKIQEFLS
ncbi:MAG: histidine--tRNA ligase, partial [Aggregatilineales bacterium]